MPGGDTPRPATPSGAFFAGVRHAMPLYPIGSLFGGTAAVVAMRNRSRVAAGAAFAAIAASLISAIPVTRAWEYRNELFGGASGAYLNFSDEGVDVGQRTKELAGY